jgi:hypothetical protein
MDDVNFHALPIEPARQRFIIENEPLEPQPVGPNPTIEIPVIVERGFFGPQDGQLRAGRHGRQGLRGSRHRQIGDDRLDDAPAHAGPVATGFSGPAPHSAQEPS